MSLFSNSGRLDALCCSLVLQYLVPGAIIVVCYWRVFAALRRRTRTKRSLMTGGSSSGSGSGGESVMSTGARRREQQAIRRSRRTNRMLIAMVAIFIVCWLPLNVINLLFEYDEEQIGKWHYILLVFFIAHVVAMSSTVYNPFPHIYLTDGAVSCVGSMWKFTDAFRHSAQCPQTRTVYNPFLYAWMNDAFRREFQRVLPVCGSIGRTSSQSDETHVQLTAATAAVVDMRSVKAGDSRRLAATKLTTFVDGRGASGDHSDNVEAQ